MKKIIGLALALSLGGCGTVGQVLNQSTSFVVTQNELDTARTAYDGAFLAPVAHYRQLGYCATGTSATLTKPCADRATVVRLRAADAAVKAQFDATQALITAGDNTGVGAAFSTLQSLIGTAEGLAASYGVK